MTKKIYKDCIFLKVKEQTLVWYFNNKGLENILIVSVYGLKGFGRVIKIRYSNSEVQTLCCPSCSVTES